MIFPGGIMRRRGTGRLVAAAVAAGTMLTMGSGGTAGAAGSLPVPVPMYQVASHDVFPTPPTTAQCERLVGAPCYAPFQFQTAYDLGPLFKKGLDGKGETIVIVDPFGYQYIRGELTTFDTAFKLPAPPSFRIIHPAGAIPPYNPKKHPSMVGCGIETSLDVEYAHTMAPGANILLVETPAAEGLGTSGFPAIVKAENYVVSHHLGTVISMSLGTAEQTFPNAQSILNLRSAFKAAAAAHISVLAAAGDQGPSNFQTNTTFFLRRTASWPATDPLVTAVGGTQLYLNDQGQRSQPDTSWNTTNLVGFPSAGGSGVSSVFARPAYQNGVARQVGLSRGIPDISMSASVDGAAIVYLAANVGFNGAGYYLIGGTSLATPLFAGVVAIADQVAGHGLGQLNPALYKMYAEHEPGIVDVTAGTSTVTFRQGGRVHTVRGWDAVKGYDLATGVGTVNAALFVPELVAATQG
jgi:subtilase family serine protease